MTDFNPKRIGRPPERSIADKWALLNAVWMWMGEGYSFRGACGQEGLPPASVMRWMAEIPDRVTDVTDEEREEIRNAIKRAHDAANAMREAKLQQRLLSAASGPAVTAAIFALKCCVGGAEEWREASPALVGIMEDDDGTTRVVIEFSDDDEDETATA